MNKALKGMLTVGLVLLFSTAYGLQKKEKAGEPDLKKAIESRAKSITNNYTIQPEDSLDIVLWKEPGVSRSVVVRPDGKITLPLIQDIQAAGLSPLELKKQLEERFKDYFSSPNVTVMMDSINSYKVYFIGKVSNQGVMTLLQPVTILQGLALAGGLEEFAKQDDIAIIRGSEKDTKVLPFNYKEVRKGNNLSQNVVLEPGDVVVVP